MSRGSYSSSHNYSHLRSGDFDEERGSSTLSYADKKLVEQDNSLDQLGRSVSRLGDLSLTISRDIDTQNRLLSDLDLDVEKAQESTSDLLQKTKDLVKKTGGTKMVCTILVLTAVLIVLFLLVLYT
jgi:t-SNARE complex subunit (syntaxin)